MDELDLSLPKCERDMSQTKSPHGWLLLLILIALVVNIVLVYVRTDHHTSIETGVRSGLSGDKLKQLALKLEKQGLHQAAMNSWEDYLASAIIDSDDKAKIWYRIGNIAMDAKDHAKALESYYRSESLARIQDLSPEIARRTQECLESLGKVTALRYELAERVGLSKTTDQTGDGVVAEIGSQKITKAQLDSRIEAQIEQQLSNLSGFVPADDLRAQKETLLKQFSTASQRLSLLNHLVLKELLYRRAIEMRIADKPDIQASLAEQKRDLLAGKVIESEYQKEIKITELDVETYYKAHKEEYVSPAKAKISHILVPDDDTVTKVLAELKEEKAFAEVAKLESTDQQTRSNGGEIDEWIERGRPAAALAYSSAASDIIFNTLQGKVADKPLKSDKGFHIIKVNELVAERQNTFDEVKTEVFRTLRSHKEKDVQERLIADLRAKYNVVIHQSSFSDEASK